MLGVVDDEVEENESDCYGNKAEYAVVCQLNGLQGR